MIKLYFKKLLWIIIFLLIYIAVYFISFNLLYTVANFFKDRNIIGKIILFGIPFICSMGIIYCLRVNNNKLRTEYLSSLLSDNYSFSKDVIFILKSKSFISEILAFETVSVPLSLSVGISEKIPILPLIIGTILLSVGGAILFGIVDLVIWLSVLKVWFAKKP